MRLLHAALVTVLVGVSTAFSVHAQVQRSFINLGFENPALPLGVQTCTKSIQGSAILTSSDVPGWETTHGPGDIWCTNNGGTTGFQVAPSGTQAIDIWKTGEVDAPNQIISREGNQHAELNAWDVSRIYQTVCLLNNEEVSWRFSHRPRDPSPTGDTMEFNIHSPALVKLSTIVTATTNDVGAGTHTCSMGTCNTPVTVDAPIPGHLPPGAYRTQWADYSGNFTWIAGSGNFQFGFEALSAPVGLDRGNLIDNIQLEGLTPFAELSSNAYTSQEGTVDNVGILFSGFVTGAPLIIEIEVTAGTAVAGTDYNAPPIIQLSIPPDPNGYQSQFFPFGDQIQILNDAEEEAPENFTLRIRDSGAFLIENTRVCGAGDAHAQATYTILDAHLSITKNQTPVDLNGSGRTDAGDRIDYEIVVTNTGGVPLADLQVNDPLLGGVLIAPPETLAVGASRTVTGSYTITPDDMLAGTVTNTATATANTPAGAVPPKSATVETILDVERSIDFIKAAGSPAYVDANSNGQIDVGEQVQFEFTIINTGNIDTVITSVVDDLPGFQFQNLTLPTTIPALPAGQQITFTGYHVVTQAEIDAGSISNGAEAFYTAAGQDGSVRSHAPGGDAQTTITFPEPAADSILALTKEIVSTDYGADGAADADDIINYRLVLTNNSSLTLHNLSLVDARLDFTENVAELGPWQSHIVDPLPYILQQADIDAGMIDNTAQATATTPRGTPLSASATSQYPLDAIPSVDFLKEAVFVNLVGSELPEVGDRVDYVFTLTNTGNITIANFSVSDPQASVEQTREPPPLQPGASDNVTFRASRIITQEDVNAGRLENVAMFRGVTSGGTEITVSSHGPDGQPTAIVFSQESKLAVQLSGTWLDENGNGIAEPGERIEYRAIITNNGNVVLTDLSLAGIAPEAGVPEGSRPLTLPVADTITSLQPGATHTVSYYYVLTQEDIDQGTLAAQLSAIGQGPESLTPENRVARGLSDDPAGGTVIDADGDGNPDRPAIVTLPQLARLSVEKTGAFPDATIAAEGTVIEYTVTITNTGNVTLFGVAPNDPGPRFSGVQGTGTLSAFVPEKVDLAPGDPPAVFNATYVASGADIENSLGSVDAVVNVASASGATASGAAPDIIPGEARLTLPGLSLSKHADVTEAFRGAQVPYTISIESRSLSLPVAVRLVDAMPAGFSYVTGTATVDGARIEPLVDGQSLIFEELTVQPERAVEVKLALNVGPGVTRGTQVNRARLFSPGSATPLTPEATAAIEVISEAYLDCGDVIGTVFNDKNRNGYQDNGEEGLPASRISTAQGMLLTTDKHGRFSVACADLPDARIGSTYIMKLDPRSLPSGYRIISENPRTVRLTAGKVTRVNFAASIGRVVRIDLADAAFIPGETNLRPEWNAKISQLIQILETEHSTLRMTYNGSESDRVLATRRMKQVRNAVEQMWKDTNNRYRLEIETRIATAER